ncbi:mediator of RNA polymerase II transcription subunit 14 isoform X2 [Hydra vulgaris]|uniref:Mediator of RNA polymerase II transcription subunit 14 n=1 Tax=Hydra vulgaris TaxID=6087 RepID=A0ABM4B6E4_HYDVU
MASIQHHHTSTSRRGINLSMLIDFLLQKTYHDLTVLSELLPRKSDIERKVEIIKFVTKARQQFIRLLALVKWASGAEKVDKCQAISTLLDQQNAYFIDTADALAKMARETLVQARLPNFSIPTAVDVLTTGSFNRLPKCIKTKIVPVDPISAEEKTKTLKRLDEVIQYRLCVSEIPKKFSNIKICDGKVTLTVQNEFEVMLMLMGDGDDIPWRLLKIKILLQDHELGDGQELVHELQINYIHQVVQSRLMIEDNPLVDLYNTLHHFCLSLQLEVFHTQCKRLISERWGDCVHIHEYVPGKILVISYCRLNLTQIQQSESRVCPQIIIQVPNGNQNLLVLSHNPPLCSEKDRIEGKLLSIGCFSIENIYFASLKKFSYQRLLKLRDELVKDAYFKTNSYINEEVPFLRLQPYPNCSTSEQLTINVDFRTGMFNISEKVSNSHIKQLQNTLWTNFSLFAQDFHKVRCSLYLERCRGSVLSLPVLPFYQLPLSNPSVGILSKLPPYRLFFKFKNYPDFVLLICLQIDLESKEKEIIEKFYLLKLLPSKFKSEQDDKSSLAYSVDYCCQLNEKLLQNINELNNFSSSFTLQEDYISSAKRRKCCVESSKQLAFNSTLHLVLLQTILRIPFIEISKQLAVHKVVFDGVHVKDDSHYNLNLLDFPLPEFCNKTDAKNFKELILSCILYIDYNTMRWVVVYQFQKLNIEFLNIDFVEFTYDMKADNIVVQILEDYRGMVKVFQHAQDIHDVLNSLHVTCGIDDFSVHSYNMKSLVLTYSPARCFNIELSFCNGKYKLSFMENGKSREKCPHYLMQDHLMQEFNKHENFQYILKIVHGTLVPLSSISSIPILPACGRSSRVLSMVNNFTFITHSSTHMKIIYRNQYILDIYFLQDSVLIRDGTLYMTDSTKAMRGFSPISQLTSFLNLFVDQGRLNNDITRGNTDFPFTPGGSTADFDQQNESLGPPSHDSTGSYKDRSMKSPAIPSPYSQHSMQSPGNPYSAPSPGTFIQPSPAYIPVMSPNAWPGSPPLVQGSPRPGKSGFARQMLTGINISNAPVPVVLSHAGFKKLLLPVATSKQTVKLCPLERFFGSILLRYELIRVMRVDDTLKLEKFDNGVVIFAGSGKNGPDTGLQYSVRLNPHTMDSLVLKVTPNKGHENLWSTDELKTLEQFFESKVVCSPYKVPALTSFARILGTQSKIMKDFVKIMKLEMQTNWNDFLFKVELCLTVPPGKISFITVPGTPAVVLKNKNLIFLQLTEVKNENNTFTVSIVHDVKANTVQYVELPKPENGPQEPVTWAVRAVASLQSLLQKISGEICKKDFPIFCTIITILKHMQVK